MGSNPWIGWKEIVAHPNSPAGGGGPGRSKNVHPLGSNLTLQTAGMFERFPDIPKLWDESVNLGTKTQSIVKDLARVDWLGNLDTKGLEGNWHELYYVWFFETSPTSLGKWSMDEGVPLVTITSAAYAHDLQRKPNYKETLAKFKKEHPDLKAIKVGDTTNNYFRFTGEGSATGKYNALEWFMGSYETKVVVSSVDLKSGSVKIRVEVLNISRWQSGTRMPKAFMNKGLPAYLIKDAPREALGPGGTFKQKFIWEDTVQYN
jgi:hypothetical protein